MKGFHTKLDGTLEGHRLNAQREKEDTFERIYSGAAAMLWAQQRPSWRIQNSGWPAGRSAAFHQLETSLLECDTSRQQDEPVDPSRHLISRRENGCPVGLREAVDSWVQRLDIDREPFVEREEVAPGQHLAPRGSVVVPARRYLVMASIFPELSHRLAPGRPGLTVSEAAADLSQLAHEAANQLRASLGVAQNSQTPGVAPWITARSTWVSDMSDLGRSLNILRSTARRAAESVPSVDELKQSFDFSVEVRTAESADRLRRILDGHSVALWTEEEDGINPELHATVGLVSDSSGAPRPMPLGEVAADWRELIADQPLPWRPQGYIRLAQGDVAESDVVLSAVQAQILAEILDEFSARLQPGLKSGTIHFCAYELVQFITWDFGREIRDLVIL
jgi:hypothetical protein